MGNYQWDYFCPFFVIFRLALEMYHDDFKIYPVVQGDSSHQRWEELSKFMDLEEYMTNLPIDPCAGKEHQYDYINSPDGQSYILKAILFSTRHSVLENDIDGKFLAFSAASRKEK